MVTAAFAGIVPTAAAQTGGTALNITAVHAYLGNSATPITSNDVIDSADTVRFEITATVASCSLAGGTPAYALTIDTDGTLTDGDFQQSGFSFSNGVGTATVPVEDNLFYSATPQTYTATITVSGCVGTTQPGGDSMAASETIFVDSLGPSVDFGTIVFDRSAQDYNVGGDTLGIGAKLTFTPVFSDPAGVSAASRTMNAAPIDGSSTVAYSGGSVTLTVAETNGGSIPAVNGASVSVVFTATDNRGNTNTENLVVKIDNQRPTTPSTWTASAGSLTRRAASTTLSLNIDAGASTSVTHAAVFAAINGSTPVVVGAIPVGSAQTMSFPADLNATVDVSILPSDAGGNSAGGTALPIAFPLATMSFGPDGDSPSSVAENAVGNVVVHVTGNGPTLPYTNANSQLFYGQLIRHTGISGDVYWIHGTSGSVISGTSTHFAPAPQLNPTVETPTKTTIFQPAGTVTGITTVVLSNLTGNSRSFEDGSYSIQFTIKNPANGYTLNLVRSFVVDSVGPSISSSAHNYTSQLGPNMTQKHGADGNPFQVHVSAQEMRFKEQQHLDSGLAKVVVELYDPVTGATVQRTATPATVQQPEANLARVTINMSDVAATIPYAYNFTSAPSGTCTVPTQSETLRCTYAMWATGNWSMTWYNTTIFNGWVNTTFPDLEAGSYGVRAIAYDNVGRSTTKIYSGSYVVEPNARIKATATSPLLVDTASGTGLDVIVEASQRYVSPPNEFRDDCVDDGVHVNGTDDVCAPRYVLLYLTNDPSTSTADGTFYRNMSIVKEDTFASSTVGGFAYPNFYNPPLYGNSPKTGLLNGTLTLTATAVSLRYMTYDPTGDPPVIPAGVDLTKPVYVRAEAVTTRSGADAVKRSTDWVLAATGDAPALSINEPGHEWEIKLVDSALDNPAFNVSFDRKGSSVVPTMEYSVAPVPSGGNVTAWIDYHAANSVSGTGAIYWTGTLNGTNNAVLAPGAYWFNVTLKEGTTTLATASRQFIVLSAMPSVEVDDTQTGYGIVSKTSSRPFIVGPQFELRFTVQHGPVNLTTIDQLDFRLLRDSASGASEIVRNQDGFVVNVRPETPLDEARTSSTFTANITLPAGSSIPNDATFRLNVTALIDTAPHALGNASTFITMVYDKVAPTGGLNEAYSVATVHDLSSINPSRNLAPTSAAFQPAFTGFVTDTGAGVGKVEVRIVDLTQDLAVELKSNGAVDTEEGTDAAFWTNVASLGWLNTTTDATQWQWTLPLKNRPGGLMPLWDGTEANKDGSRYRFSLAHTYQVFVRMTDNLGQMSESNATFDFDATPPDLAYGDRLGGVSSDKPSGIRLNQASTTIPWHALESDAAMSVSVMDNHCIAEVRLWARSDLHPERTDSFIMAPIGYSDDDPVCPPANAPLPYVNFTLDLEDAPNLTEDVSTYTFWFSATDLAGQTSIVPESFRTMRVNVIDVTPASVSNVTVDPNPGLSGGKALIRADVFDNAGIERVEVTLRDANASGVVYARGNMTAANSTQNVGLYTLDLDLPAAVRDYRIYVQPFDINWDRADVDGGPTCEDLECPVFGMPDVYRVRDDGPPQVSLLSPNPAQATVNATPTIVVRGQHKLLETSGISVRVSTDGNESNLTAVPIAELNFTEQTSANGTRQGWNVAYTPATPLDDNATLLVNVSVSAGGLVAAETYTFRVDAVGPTATANVTGTRAAGNRTFATSGTRVTITANDTVSATTIFYRVGAGAPVTYSGPLTPSGEGATWSIEYWAVDSANNIGAKQTLTLTLDLAGPTINVGQHGDTIVLFVNDTGSGVNESTVTVHYRYGPGTTFSTLVAQKVINNSYSATLPGDASATGLSYYFTAEDLIGQLGNAYSAAEPYDIGSGNETPSNLPPTIRITSPTAGGSVGSLFDLKWLAEDPEGAPLSISIALRDPAPGRVLSAGGENSGSFRVNLTGLPAGAYTLVVTANDGENSASGQVSFNLEAGKAIQPQTVPPATVQPNTQVSIAVAIQPTGKTVAQATYRLMRGDELATQGRLAPSQGLYAAGFTPTEAGDYTVFVEVVYTDGTTEPSTQVAAFTVPDLDGDNPEVARGVFPVSLMALGAIAILTVALAAYGAFGRWKK